MKAKTIVLLVLIGLFLIILIQNTQVVTLQLLPFWEIAISHVILILLAMLIGFILGYIAAKATGGTRNRGEHKKEV